MLLQWCSVWLLAASSIAADATGSDAAAPQPSPAAVAPALRDCRDLSAAELRDCYRANAAVRVAADPASQAVPPDAERAPPPPEVQLVRRSRPAMFAGMGIAGGGAMVALANGLTLALQLEERDKCNRASLCLNKSQIEFNVTVQAMLIAVGGVAALTGLGLLLYGAPLVPAPEQTVSLRVVVGAGGVALWGAF